MARNLLVQIPNDKVSLFLDEAGKKALMRLGEVEWNPYDRPFTQDELKERIRGKHAVITTWGSQRLTDAVLDEADQLQLIAHMAGAIKPILSTDAVYKRGIRVLNSNFAIGVSVGESVLALILAIGHRIIPVYQQIQAGGLPQGFHYETYELRGRTVGLVGLGMVAREVIKMLQPFGVRLLGYDPFITEETAFSLGVELRGLHELISASDIVTLHAAMVPETYHMIGRRELAMMRDGAILINTSRGDLIDEEALIMELAKKRFYAGLDVVSVEPIREDHPFRNMENVLVRPHLAGVNPDSRRRIGTWMIEEIGRFYDDMPLRFEVKEEQLSIMT
jgi:phosphoglycerate dehydrogenase-like enzyme